MIVDHRTYELQPGRLRDFLALYEKEGLPVQKSISAILSAFTTEVGNVKRDRAYLGLRRSRRSAPSAARRWLPTRHGRPTCRRAENS